MKRERLLEILSAVDSEVTEEFTDSDLIDYGTCLQKVQDEMVDEARWWQYWEAVYKVQDGVFLCYSYPRSSGDRTPWEQGYEGNGLGDIWEVQEKIVQRTVYVAKD